MLSTIRKNKYTCTFKTFNLFVIWHIINSPYSNFYAVSCLIMKALRLRKIMSCQLFLLILLTQRTHYLPRPQTESPFAFCSVREGHFSQRELSLLHMALITKQCAVHRLLLKPPRSIYNSTRKKLVEKCI